VNQYESAIYVAVQGIVSLYNDALVSRGIELRLSPLREVDGANRNAEIEINIFSHGKFQDVLEFFITWDGIDKTTVGEVEKWLRGELNHSLGVE